MTNKKIALVIILTLILTASMLISSCTTGRVIAENQKDAEPIKIGTLFALSGKLAYSGEQQRQGIEMAKDEINTAGGINGRLIEIVYEDSQGDIKTAIPAYQKLVDFENTHVILTTISGVTLGVAPLAEKDKNIFFNIASYSPDISQAGDYVFRHSVLTQDEIDAVAEFMYKKGYHRVGTIYTSSASAASIRPMFKEAFGNLGGKIIIEEAYETGATDYKTQLLKIKSANPDAVIMMSYAVEAGLILKQSKELGYDPEWFAIGDFENDEALRLAGDAAEGVIYAHYFAPGISSLTDAFEQKFKEIYGKSATPYSALAYDSLKVLAEAMRKCENPENTDCIKENLYKTKDFPGVTGPLTFDSNGDTRKLMFMKTVKDGKFVKLE